MIRVPDRTVVGCGLQVMSPGDRGVSTMMGFAGQGLVKRRSSQLRSDTAASARDAFVYFDTCGFRC
jgi:hypothetical protein